MYERSAIVLERYIEKILEFDKTYNLKKNNDNYWELIQEIETYQNITNKESKFIQEFDEKVKVIDNFQQEQEKLSKANKILEDDRIQLFIDLGEEPKVLDNKLRKIEMTVEKNNKRLAEIRENFIQELDDFSQQQKERNKCEKTKRVGEAKHFEYIKNANVEFKEINVKQLANLKDFMSSEKEQIKQEVLEIMIKNGKNEKVEFNQDVFKKAIKARIEIAEKEAECYILVYDRMKKLLDETDSEVIKLNKYQKVLRDTSVKLAFLKAEKEYIVGFLDYERMTAVSGSRAHKNMMVEACNNFELDMMQIKNLYELVLKEIANKSSKKAYAELYNKTYLKSIEDKERNFEKEVNNVNISMGTVINQNYWRIEGIKNIYEVFQKEISEKFGKDLSEYRLDESEIDEYDYDDEDYDDEGNNDQLYKFEIQDENDGNEYGDNLYKFKIYDEIDEENQIKFNDNTSDNNHKIVNDSNYNNYNNYNYNDLEDIKNEEEKSPEEIIFYDEESIETIIARSRKKGIKEKHEKDTKRLFNKLFKK